MAEESRGTGPSGTGGSQVNVASLEREADLIQKKFEELRALQGTARRNYLFLAIIIVVLFGVFIYATAYSIHQNFNQSAVQQALAAAMPDLMDQARGQLQQAGTAAMPYYRDALIERAKTAGPEMAEQAQARMAIVPETAGKALQSKLDVIFARTLDRISPEVMKAYPNISDARKQDLIHVAFHDAVTDQTKDLTEHVTNQYVGEMALFEGLLKKFDLPDVDEKTSKEEYVRLFLHNVILLMDMNIMQGNDTIAPSATAPVVNLPQP